VEGVEMLAEPVKLTVFTFAPLIETEAEGGVNVYPGLLAVIEYEPFCNPAKV
jgi:hypothetical protein